MIRRRRRRQPTTAGRTPRPACAALFARWEAADRRRRSAGTSAQLDRVLSHRLAVVLVGRRAAGGDARRLWARGCAASSSPRSTPAPSRSTSGRRAARGSRRPRSGSPRSRSSSAKTIGEDLQLDHLRARRRRRLVGRLHAQRRPDGRGRQGPAHARARALGPGIRRSSSATGFAGDPRVPRPGVRLRRRRHDPLGDERGQVDADQHPPHRQEPGAGPRDRRGDQARGRRDRRRGRRPDHPAARLPRVHHRRRPGQGRPTSG